MSTKINTPLKINQMLIPKGGKSHRIAAWSITYDAIKNLRSHLTGEISNICLNVCKEV